MDLIQFHSFSSAWYWFALIAIWAVFCQLYLGMSYHQLRLARQRHPERQGVLLRALALYLERMRWSTVSNIGPFVAGLCAFVLSFWSVVAFFYNVEILQAFFFLFVPLGPSLILRWRLARRLAKEIPDFEAVFRQIRTIRYWTLLSSFLTILMSTFWGVRVILREYSGF